MLTDQENKKIKVDYELEEIDRIHSVGHIDLSHIHVAGGKPCGRSKILPKNAKRICNSTLVVYI